MNGTIEVIVSPTGETRIETKGFAGSSCRDASRFIEQSLGNIHRPLSDKQLEEKLRDQCMPELSASQVDRLIELCWKIDQLDDVSEVVKATVRS